MSHHPLRDRQRVISIGFLVCLGAVIGFSFLPLNAPVVPVVNVAAPVIKYSPPAPVTASCKPARLIALTTPNGISEEFSVEAIAAVLPNAGTFPGSVHAVIVLTGGERIGVKQDIATVAAMMTDHCRP